MPPKLARSGIQFSPTFAIVLAFYLIGLRDSEFLISLSSFVVINASVLDLFKMSFFSEKGTFE